VTESTETLTHAQIDSTLSAQVGWRRGQDTLVRELQFRDFDAALAFVERLGDMANDYGRRPDMCISEFNHVKLSVSNPHHAGLTRAELRLAAKVDTVIEQLPQETR
jgi:4a-hydroxytetrahydrobiopterin dehydratase